MPRAKAEHAVVLDGTVTAGGTPPIRGLITKARLAEVLIEGMEIFGDEPQRPRRNARRGRSSPPGNKKGGATAVDAR